MAPRVKHVYKSSTSNNRRSLTLFEREKERDSSSKDSNNKDSNNKDSINKDLNNKDSSKKDSINKDSSNKNSRDSSAILQSLKGGSNVKAQQEQVQKMRSDLQAQERKILQDISNLNKAPLPKPFKIPNVPNILPDDINEHERISFTIPDEFPSFNDSPIIFKETSFNQTQDSFVFIDKSPIVKSSSPNKVPVVVSTSVSGSNDLLTSESGNIFEYQDNRTEKCKDENESADISITTKSIQSLASPISQESIIVPTEIDFFTIEPEFLQSFEGIWRKKLDHPIRSIDPSSPDHFDRIPMASKGGKSKNREQKRK